MTTKPAIDRELLAKRFAASRKYSPGGSKVLEQLPGVLDTYWAAKATRKQVFHTLPIYDRLLVRIENVQRWAEVNYPQARFYVNILMP